MAWIIRTDSFDPIYVHYDPEHGPVPVRNRLLATAFQKQEDANEICAEVNSYNQGSYITEEVE